jgi:hypothetical protein
MMGQNVENVRKQPPPTRAPQPLLVPCLREGLTGKAGAENVVLGDLPKGDTPNISVSFKAKVLSVKSPETVVNFSREDAFVAQPLESKVKATKPCE